MNSKQKTVLSLVAAGLIGGAAARSAFANEEGGEAGKAKAGEAGCKGKEGCNGKEGCSESSCKGKEHHEGKGKKHAKKKGKKDEHHEEHHEEGAAKPEAK